VIHSRVSRQLVEANYIILLLFHTIWQSDLMLCRRWRHCVLSLIYFSHSSLLSLWFVQPFRIHSIRYMSRCVQFSLFNCFILLTQYEGVWITRNGSNKMNLRIINHKHDFMYAALHFSTILCVCLCYINFFHFFLSQSQSLSIAAAAVVAVVINYMFLCVSDADG
jgi:hypothetical protein